MAKRKPKPKRIPRKPSAAVMPSKVWGAMMTAPLQQLGAAAVNVLAAPIFPQYSRVAHIIAHRLARRTVERQLRDQGVHLPNYAQVRALAREYLSAHPELLDQAACASAK